MKLQKYAFLAEIVGAVGIVVSLVFVGFQLKGNSDLLAAQAVFDLRDSNSFMSRDMVTNPEFAEIVYRGNYDDDESLTAVEKWRFDFWVEEVLTHRMTAWKYAEEGLLDPEEIESWQSVTCAYVAIPGVRKVWDRGGTWLRADFRVYVERSCFGDDGSR